MSKEQSASSCEKHLVANVRSKTNDRQAHTDSARPHRAWRRGWDRVNGTTVQFYPVKLQKITWEDVRVWRERMLAAGMKQSSINAYDSALKRGWEFVFCDCPELNSSKTSQSESNSARNVAVNENVPSLKKILRGNINKSHENRTGFKLSVCQKSLSLALKHAWAHDQLSTPPVCPVDRIILDLASKATGQSWRTNWTDVNSLEEYEDHLNLISAASGHRKIAEWELLSFERLIPSVFVSASSNHVEIVIDQNVLIQEGKIKFIRRFSGGVQGHEDWPEQMLKDCLRSSLQHNGTYLPLTPESIKVQIRHAMREFIVEFLIRWEEHPEVERTILMFENEMVLFQTFMNEKYSQWFR